MVQSKGESMTPEEIRLRQRISAMHRAVDKQSRWLSLIFTNTRWWYVLTWMSVSVGITGALVRYAGMK